MCQPRPFAGRLLANRPAAATIGTDKEPMEDWMPDDEPADPHEKLEERIALASGNAMIGSLMLPLLLVKLVREGVLTDAWVRSLTDQTLLALEQRHHPLDKQDQRAWEQAIRLLERLYEQLGAPP